VCSECCGVMTLRRNFYDVVAKIGLMCCVILSDAKWSKRSDVAIK